MPVVLLDAGDTIDNEDAARLWNHTLAYTRHADDEVSVRFVDEADSKRLNQEYRRMNSPTNVLTFSYGDVHDIAVCLPVAKREASERGVALRDYVALLLVHAFLHAAGFDHERSEEDALLMRQAEQAILPRAGLAALSLE